jgi:hypothetical protein
MAGMVTIRNNMLTCNLHGKPINMHLQFGPNGMLHASRATDAQGGQAGTERPGATGTTTEQPGRPPYPANRGAGQPALGQGNHQGVYVLSHQYLCLAFNDGSGTGAHRPGTTVPGAGGGAAAQGTGIGQPTAGRPGQAGTPAPGTSQLGQAGAGQAGTGQTTTSHYGATTGAGAQSASFILILRRAGGAPTGR